MAEQRFQYQVRKLAKHKPGGEAGLREEGGYRGSRFMAPGYLLLWLLAVLIVPVAAMFIFLMIYPR